MSVDRSMLFSFSNHGFYTQRKKIAAYAAREHNMREYLFSPVAFGGLRLANRIVRSATWEGMATEEGLPTDRLVSLMSDLAKGGCGLIITAHANVSPEGQASPKQVRSYGEDAREGLARMAGAAHNHGVPIVLQLGHGGLASGFTKEPLPRLGPSALDGGTAMTKEDIKRETAAFAQAAALARQTGYDGVQIHAAHSYLLSQFLCPYSNRRDDEYGGDIQGRARFLLEVYTAVREAVGPDFPVLVKINCTDFMDEGISVEDFVTVCLMLEKAGINGIEISGGSRFGTRGAIPAGKVALGPDEGYYRQWAHHYKEKVKVPLIMVGGFRSVEGTGGAIKEGLTDAVSFSRPFVREPDFPIKWKKGLTDAVTCVSCNLCLKEAVNSYLQCMVK